MARIQTKKSSFSRGVISEKMALRDDLELYLSGLADGENFVVDGRGGLEKRPGFSFLVPTKNNGFATLLPFAYSRTQAYLIEAGQNYFRFITNYAQLTTGMTPYELATPFAAADVEKITTAQSNDVMFFACEGYKYGRLVRTGATTFALGDYSTFDGPYLELNGVTAHKLQAIATGNRIVASGAGFTPFTPGMVGRWIRIRSPNTDSADANELGDEFLWAFYQIVSYVSPTEVTVDLVPGNIAATEDWRLGAFYTGEYPDVVTMHQGRLWWFKGNRGWSTKPQDFNNFSPTYHDPEGGATGRVEPDSAISVVLDSGLSQQGAVTKVLWAKSQNFQLVIGTPVGIITIQSNSLGDGLTPSNAVARAHDARGAGAALPVTVHESTLFVHTTGMRLQGTYYKNGAYDRIGAQDLSLPSDTIITSPIRRLAWQDYPHGAVFSCMLDGNLNALSLQPEEEVQGWYPQRLGGRYVRNGLIEHPHVEAVMSMPAPGGGERDDHYVIVKRTINGQERRYIEVQQPYWTKGRDVRTAWFLDSGLRYDGNDDIGKTITVDGDDPNFLFNVTTNFTSPAFQPASKFGFSDGRRWHIGTIVAVDGSNNFTWEAARPNAPAGPTDGLRWFYDEALDEWVQAAEGDDDYFLPDDPTYEAPAPAGAIWRWSQAVQKVSGADHLIGEWVQGLIDGVPTELAQVDEDGEVDFGWGGTTILVGLPYSSFGQLLDINEGAQAGTADMKHRPIYATGISVWETWGLEVGSRAIDTHNRVWENYAPTFFDPPYLEGEPAPLFTGTKMFEGSQQADTTTPVVAFRHREPLPCYVRAVINRISTSDGA